MNEQEIYTGALERTDPADRKTYLDEACAGDPALRERLESLIRQSDQLGSFLEHPPLEAAIGSSGAWDATVQFGDGSTADDREAVFNNHLATRRNPHEQDEELPLGYLEPATREDSLGRLDHYEVLNVIGKGAFGTVLRAFDTKLERVVAIKVLALEMASMSPARKRFLREARASAQIRHENVVGIHSVEEKPIPYLVMEYVPGKTLQEQLEQHGPLGLPDVLRLGKQIADGLAAAHAQGLIHRDIKPGNILLEGGMNERVKLTDFGLARTADDASMTQSGMIAGTPMYMAPEQAHGQKLDQRADLFSLGSVLYHMLSGRPPFRATTTVAVLKRVAEDTPRPIQEIIPEVPDWMCEIVARLHAKNPDERYGSASEVSELLARCAADLQAGRVPTNPHRSRSAESVRGESTAGVPESVPAPGGEPLLSSPMIKVAAAVVILLGALGIAEATGVTRLCSTVIRLATGSGTLVIETDDPDVKIAINGEEVTIKGGGVEELTLRPGEYTVAALKDGRPVKQELVSIERNGRTVVRMSLEQSDTNTKPVGSSQISSGSTVHDYALSFDGTDDSVQTPVRFDVAKPLTVEAIITVPEKPGHNQVVLADAELGGFGLGPRENGKWRMDLQSQAGKQRDEVGYVRLESDNPITYGVPTHVATIYDGRVLRLYVNGRLQSRRIPVKDLVPSSLPIMIGANPGLKNKTAEHFLGTIDEVRISNVARYTGDFTPDKRFESDEHTLALYHFDEGSGDVLKDSSGKGQQGKIVGAKWVRVGDGSNAADPQSGGWHGWSADAPPPAIAPFDAAQAKAHQEAWAKHLGVPVEYTNSIGMKFRLIPPGEFMMGSTPEQIEAAMKVSGGDEGWKEWINSEPPPHKVILTQPLYFGVTEVTQSQYEHIMGRNPSDFSASGGRKEAVVNMETGNHPVETVSWNEVAEFCSRLSQQENLKPFYSRDGETVSLLAGTGYRLPTEAEWEFACRAGTTTWFWSGDANGDLASVGWFGHNAGHRTHAVGELKANPFGLFDMHGNVWESVQDSWDAAASEKVNESPVINPLRPFSAGSRQVFRGGNWDDHPTNCRSSTRLAHPATFRHYGIGFRAALTVDAVKKMVSEKPTASTPPPAIAPFDAAQAKSHQEAWAKHLGVPVEYTNSIGMKFRLIPPGEFMMGSTLEEVEDYITKIPEWAKQLVLSETPQRKVRIAEPFYLGRTEVTVGQFKQFVAATKYKTHAETNGRGGTVWTGERHEVKPEFTWQHPDLTRSDTHPVGQLCHADAMAFCRWLADLEKQNYRLPNEDQWEHACRAGTTTPWSCGNDLETQKLHDLIGWDLAFTGREVGQKPANPFGLFDMHGNLEELCLSTQDRWVARGGATGNDSLLARSAFRSVINREDTFALRSFRVALVDVKAKH